MCDTTSIEVIGLAVFTGRDALKRFVPVLSGVAAILLGQQGHEQGHVMLVVGGAILHWITVDLQLSDATQFPVDNIPGYKDTDPSPTAVISDGRFITIHEPVVLHCLGNVAKFDNAHGSTGNGQIHWE